MNAFSTAMLSWKRNFLLGALAAPFLVTGQTAHSQVDFGAMNLSASVHEALVRPTSDPKTFVEEQKIFDDAHETPDAGPHERAEYLYHASQGANLSGRSSNIQDAFASALAEGDHNGGVGVTSWIGADPSPSNPDALEQLAAHATWTQDFANNGAGVEDTFAHLEIPALQVGVIGVVSQASVASVLETETAEAEATLAFIVTHADGSTSKGPLLEFGVRIFEKQEVSGAQLFNVVDHEFIGVNDKTLPLFKSFRDNGNPTNRRLDIDAVSFDVDTGVLEPGDTLDVVYQLTAEGTTHGGEQGFVAFLGDPFGLEATGDFVLNVTPVSVPAAPEPATWVLMILGFGAVAGIATRRRAWSLLSHAPWR
jgi:hypothetical protein